jgi:integrase
MQSSLYDIIKAAKPNASAATIKTYVSLLNSTFYKHHSRSTPFDIEWFKDQDYIIELTNDFKPATKKTLMASLMAIMPDSEKYREVMIQGIKDANKEAIKQEKSMAQSQNWKDFSEIQMIYKNYETKSKPLLNSKTTLSVQELVRLSDFILLAVASGVFLAPRRSTDWTEMKIRNWTEHDNYVDMKRNVFVFKIFKTSKHYEGGQEVEIPPKLKLILKKWISKNPTDYLLVNTAMNKLDNSRITQILNKMFGGLNISTSMLRHIYLSEKLKDIPRLADLQKLADDMAHSVPMQLKYIKK